MIASSLEELHYVNMGQILGYIGEEIETEYLNNTKQHYIEYVARFVNIVCKEKEKMDEIKNQEERSEFCAKLASYKEAILEQKPDKLCEDLARLYKNGKLNSLNLITKR